MLAAVSANPHQHFYAESAVPGKMCAKIGRRYRLPTAQQVRASLHIDLPPRLRCEFRRRSESLRAVVRNSVAAVAERQAEGAVRSKCQLLPFGHSEISAMAIAACLH